MRRHVGFHLASAACREVTTRGRTPFGLASLRAGRSWMAIGYVLSQGWPCRCHHVAGTAGVAAVNTAHVRTAAP